MWYPILITVLTGYMLGNLNGAIAVSSLMKDDVRSHGSGNAGLTNFIRSYGAGKSLFVILIDAVKTVLACLAGGLILSSEGKEALGTALGGLGVMLGHCFPATQGFKGGKGILSGLFVALSCDWRIGVLILAVFAVFYFITWYVSLGSVLASMGFAAGFVIWHHNDLPVMICGIAMGCLAIFMHRSNIVRLLKGNERKTNLFSKKGTAEK